MSRTLVGMESAVLPIVVACSAAVLVFVGCWFIQRYARKTEELYPGV